MYLIVSLYVMKYSTDILLIAPGIMGIIFSASRILDALLDPLAGYWSDRTASRFGRRKFWMLLSIVPTALLFYMIFAQPASLAGTSLILWMALAIIGYYAAITFCFIPHMSLGAELSVDTHQRSRLFGYRHAAYTVGSILALLSLQVFINAEQLGRDRVQATAGNFAIGAGLLFAVMVAFAALVLNEQPAHARVRPRQIYASFRDVWRNLDARLLLIVTFIENIGFAAITVLVLYVMQYIFDRPLLATVVILAYMLPSAGFAPLWPRLARRTGKARLWIYSMLLTALSFGGMFPVMYYDLPFRFEIFVALTVLSGLAAGCGGTIGPSVLSDLIDGDELLTGERKEGVYFAALNFVIKSAYGVMLLLTGFILQATGFIPNAEQPPSATFAMIWLYSIFPLACYLIGAWMFRRFQLDERAHAAIRKELDKAGRISVQG
jgi:GPH family glycoside/pentoside/hexuronide:cation symporter